MADTKRMPKPMTSKKLAQYRELRAELIVQAELIMSVFHPLDDREHVTEVEFDMEHPLGPHINIWYDGYAYGEDYHEFFPCPENYLGMTEDELRAEKKRLEEEEKRKKAEKAAKAKAAREKRKAEKAKEEIGKRYKKYLELKKEFEGVTESPDKRSAEISATRGIGGAPVKEAVYLCKYWEHDDNDPSGCGETWQWCHSEKSGRRECECKRTYAMQFCPFYKKGKLAGKWVIDDVDKQAAEEFKKKFEGRADKQ